MSRLPRSSPWGAVEHCTVMSDGVFQVSTARHGGIMVRKNAADFLSPEARKAADNEGNYLCYEEDTDANIVIRELLDKKMWQIPDRFSNKAQYEDNVNESLQGWNPEYWKARQQRIAPQAEPPAKAPVQPKPSTLAGRLEAGKAKAAAQNSNPPAAPRRTKADTVVGE